MGKSTVAGFFKNAGAPIISADDIVHDLYAGKAAPLIDEAFPGSLTDDGQVDRAKLMQNLTKEADETGNNFKKLEAIIHPLVRQAQWAFLQNAKATGASLAVIEIPLLFETGAESMMDVTVLVSAPAEIQKQRALERPGMTLEKFTKLNEKQMPDQEKRRKADFIIDTSKQPKDTEADVKNLIEKLEAIPPGAYQRWENKYQHKNEGL